nr:hypothetical protein [Tanacetum cinerariifolium]
MVASSSTQVKLAGLVKQEVEKDVPMEKKLRKVCLELIEANTNRRKVIRKLEKRTSDAFAEGAVRMLKKIVPAFLKELIGKVHGIQVPLLELSRFEIPLGELEDMRFSRVLLQSPQMIKVSPSIGMWTTFSSQMILA